MAEFAGGVVAISRKPACELNPNVGLKSPVDVRFSSRYLPSPACIADGASEGRGTRRGVRSYAVVGRRRLSDAEDVTRCGALGRVGGSSSGSDSESGWE